MVVIISLRNFVIALAASLSEGRVMASQMVDILGDADAPIYSRQTKVLDIWKMWCYYVVNNFITQMHLSRNQYIRKYLQRVVGWCKTIGTAVWNSFCEQCTELRAIF